MWVAIKGIASGGVRYELEFSWPSNPCASAVGGLEDGALAVWDHRDRILHWNLQYQFMVWIWARAFEVGKI